MSTEKKESTTTFSTLSADDIQRLLSDRSAKAQMDIVEKLTELYVADESTALSDKERAIANDIFRLLLARAGVLVRATLATLLSQANTLPPELARQIAADVNEVANPVLQYSDVLSDADLIGVVKAMPDTEKLQAIAKRETVSERVSEVLVDTAIDPVVSTLMHNEGASITDQTFARIVEHHCTSAEVMDALLARHAVPPSVVEKVIQHVSGAMRQNLEQKFGNLADIGRTRSDLNTNFEQTTHKMLAFSSADAGLTQLIKQLNAELLSPFSALVLGNLQLFETSLSRLLRIPVANVHILIQDPKGFKMVYERAKLPAALFDATSLGLRALREMEQQSMDKTGKQQVYTTRQVMERMREIAGDKKPEGLDRLFALMEHCAS